jgi:hypothetical protein
VVFAAGNGATGSYTVNVTGTRSVAALKFEEGTVTLNGAGSISAGSYEVANGVTAKITTTIAGAITKTGAGTLQLTKIPQGASAAINNGTLHVLESSPGLSSGHPSGSNASVSRPASLAIANNGAPLGSRVYNGTLDLTNNDLILDYTGSSPIASIEDMVRSGYNVTGDWAGKGITSSTAAVDGNYVIAIADNATLAAPFGTLQGGLLFAGVDVDLTSVLIKFTHRADLNLDGVITPDDSAIFGGNYDENQPAVWATGDMNYDGVFTPDDAAIFGGAYDESLNSLPEPGNLCVLGVFGFAVARRRERAPHG